jgi:hypothetical protein
MKIVIIDIVYTYIYMYMCVCAGQVNTASAQRSQTPNTFNN